MIKCPLLYNTLYHMTFNLLKSFNFEIKNQPQIKLPPPWLTKT